jgi:putative phosphoesterase
VVEQLAEVAPVVAVAGNCDPPSVAEALPTSQELQLAGRTIGIHHGHQPHALQQRYIGFDYDAPEMHLFYRTMRGLLPRADIVVFGHFHAPVIKRWENCLFLSPGAITYGRSTFAMLSLGAKTDVSIREVRIERADLRRT